MPNYRVTHEGGSHAIYEGPADSPEDALLRAVADVGDWEPEIFHDQLAHPRTFRFNSVKEALERFVPEAIAEIEEV